MAGTFEESPHTDVPFAKSCETFIVTSEQFWGRAARASWTRKSLRALVIFALDTSNGEALLFLSTQQSAGARLALTQKAIS
jgi:hypothetical protein